MGTRNLTPYETGQPNSRNRGQDKYLVGIVILISFLRLDAFRRQISCWTNFKKKKKNA